MLASPLDGCVEVSWLIVKTLVLIALVCILTLHLVLRPPVLVSEAVWVVHGVIQRIVVPVRSSALKRTGLRRRSSLGAEGSAVER